MNYQQSWWNGEDDSKVRYTEARSRYSNEDRLEVVRQFMEGELSVDQIVERHQLSSPQVFYGWVGRCIEETLQLPKNQDPAGPASTDDALDQSKEIERLKKALELEKLRSAGYRRMIELAEQQFNIPIRKKSGTKR